MELSQLRYFLAAARTGSFSAAARDQYVAQQSLSKAIANLEAELGSPLFERTSKGVSVTPYGEIVLASATTILAEEERMLAQIQQLRESGQQRLSLVLSQNLQVNPAGFKEVIDCCAEKGLSVEWRDAPNGACLEGVVSGKADAACLLAMRPPSCEGVQSHFLGDAQLYLTLDKKLPFASRPNLTSRELSELVFPYYDESMKSIVRAAVAEENPAAEPTFKFLDPQSSQFELFLLTQCNATVVVANFVLAATSGAHTVRPFPDNGWKPGIYLVMRNGSESNGRVLLSVLKGIPRPLREMMFSGPPLIREELDDFLEGTV